jgi:hypothetical protein
MRTGLPAAGCDPDEGYLWAWLLSTTDDQELPGVLVLAEELLPLTALAKGPAKHLGGGPDHRMDSCLQAVVQRLGRSPGIGWLFLDVALSNRVIGVRNSALRTLDAWPRTTWPEEVVPTLHRVVWREPNDETQKRMRELLKTPGL